MNDLINRKSSRPKTVSKLINTIHSTLGKSKGVRLIEAETVYQRLCEKGFVRAKDEKVSYSLPEHH